MTEPTPATPDSIADAADMAEVEEQNLGAEATVPPDLAAAIAEGDRLGDAFRERTRGMEQITGEEMRTVVGGPYVCEAMPGVDAPAEGDYRTALAEARRTLKVCAHYGATPNDALVANRRLDEPVDELTAERVIGDRLREMIADRDATIASLRERLDAALSELGTLRRLHHAGPDPRDATIADLRRQVEERAECTIDRDHWRQRYSDLADRVHASAMEHWTPLFGGTYPVEPAADNLNRIERAIEDMTARRDRAHRLHQRALAANRKLRAGKRGGRK